MTRNRNYIAKGLEFFIGLTLVFSVSVFQASCEQNESSVEPVESDVLEGRDNPAVKRNIDKEIQPVKLFFNPRNEVISVGNKLRFDVRGEFDVVIDKDISDDVSWESENKEVADFVEQGLLVGKKEGTTNIVLRLGEMVETTQIKVIAATNQNLIMIPAKKTLELFLKDGSPVPQTLQYQSVIIRSDGSLIETTSESRWEIASLTAEEYAALPIPEIQDDDYSYVGNLEALKWEPLESANFTISSAGNYFLKTTFTNEDQTESVVYGKIEATVEPLRAVGLSVTNSPITIPIGSLEEIQVEISYNDGTKKQVTEGFKVELSSKEGAELQEGKFIKAIATGQSSFKITLDNLNAEGILYGLKSVLESIYAEPSGAIVKKGLKTNFNVYAKYNDGIIRNVTRFANYTNLTTDFIALEPDSITNQPQITSLEFGRGEVKATFEGMETSFTVDVSNSKIDSIQFVPELIDLTVGTGDTYNKYYKIFGNKSDGSRVDLTNIATVEVKGQSLVELFEEEPGKVRGVISGNTKLEATITDPTTGLKVKNRADIAVTDADALDLTWDKSTNTCPNFVMPDEYSELPCFQVNQGLSVNLGRVIARLSDGNDSPAELDAQLFVELLDYEGTNFESTGKLRMDTRTYEVYFDSLKEGHTLAVVEYKGLVVKAWVYTGPPRIDSVLLFRVDPFLGVGAGRQFAQVGSNSQGSVTQVDKNQEAEYRAFIQYSHYHTLNQEDRQQDVTVVDLADHPNLEITWTDTSIFSGGIVDLGDPEMEQPKVYRITGDEEGTDSLRVNAKLTINYSSGSEVETIETTTPVNIRTTCNSPGRRYGDFCFILSSAGESCTTACNNLNIGLTGTPWDGAHDATNSYIGSGAENFSVCEAILDDLYSSSYEIFTSRRPTPTDGLGCGILTADGEQVGVYNGVEVNSDGSDVGISSADFRRVCACDHD